MPQLNEARDRLESMTSALLGVVEPFKKNLGAVLAEAHKTTLANVREHVRPIIRKAVEEETDSMREAARAVFQAEIVPPLRQVTAQLQNAAEATQDPWERWLVHAATVFGTALAMTLLLLILQWPARGTVPVPTAISEAPAPAPPASHSERSRARK